MEEEGIEGSVEFQFMATTQKKAVTQDINVNIDATCDGISADKINWFFQNCRNKIKCYSFKPITLSITDWDELENIKEGKLYSENKITGIESTATDVANAAYYQEIVLKISKSAERKKGECTAHQC